MSFSLAEIPMEGEVVKASSTWQTRFFFPSMRKASVRHGFK